MRYVTITGPNNDIDRVINKYLSKYEIHLENSIQELSKTNKTLTAYVDVNPYKSLITRASEYLSFIGDTKGLKADETMTVDDAEAFINDVDYNISSMKTKIANLTKAKDELVDKYNNTHPFVNLDYDIKGILDLDYVKFRFGRVPIQFYDALKDYADKNASSILIQCDTDEDYVWLVYFVPDVESRKIDATYTSLHFERTFIPNDIAGTPELACSILQEKIDNLNKHINNINEDLKKSLTEDKQKIFSAYRRLKLASDNFDVRKMATHTNNKYDNFYIICGWMGEKDANDLLEKIKSDDNVVIIIENKDGSKKKNPPTKLKNPLIFKPFEMYTKMYGLPNYNEMDPTLFIAITYSIIFGAMFGDVGQGLCLAIFGFLLYFVKKINLAYIIGMCGIFSTVFGFLFGSIFGFEEIIEPVWLRPVDAMSKVPVIGSLNTVFVAAIGVGMMLVLLTMIFHMINAIITKDFLNTYLDNNALAGFLFYSSLVIIVLLAMFNKKMPSGPVIALMFLIPLFFIALKEPITHKITKKKPAEKVSVGMFIVQTFFELFEVLLSYFSNTLSFIRVGAFAVSHASMMSVVLMLAGADKGNGHTNWIIIILGNLFVMGLEGLIVGIQVLRLEYYEMFSRFYKGNGREFKPFNQA